MSLREKPLLCSQMQCLDALTKDYILFIVYLLSKKLAQNKGPLV